MKNLHSAGAMALALICLSGCNAVNAWVAGAESNVAADAAGAANNLHTANVLAVEAWKREACALTLGGLAGAADPVATKAAVQSCPPNGIVVVQGSDGLNVSLPPAVMPPAPNPLAEPAGAKEAQ